MVERVVNALSYSSVPFATDLITAYQISSVFWAVKYLEKFNLKVTAALADETPQNRKFFRMHKHLVGDSDTEIENPTKNIYTKEMRFMYVFANVAHLSETERNFLFHSYSGRGTRYIWNNGVSFYGHT